MVSIKNGIKIIINKLCQLYRKGWWVILREKEGACETWGVWGEEGGCDRCLHEHKVLQFVWKILNGHVQVSVHDLQQQESQHPILPVTGANVGS